MPETSADPIPSTAALRRIKDLTESAEYSIVFQPIVHIGSRQLLGVEALSRFNAEPQIGTQQHFADAEKHGVLTELEICAAMKAFEWLRLLPKDALLFVNISPQTVLSVEFDHVIPNDVADRLILDLSAEAKVPSYRDLVPALEALRKRGIRIAIDDAGGVTANLVHLAMLEPDVVKLDPILTRNVSKSAPHRAIARALIAFANELEADVVAEAIETDEELAALIDLGVEYGQGFLLGHPAALA